EAVDRTDGQPLREGVEGGRAALPGRAMDEEREVGVPTGLRDLEAFVEPERLHASDVGQRRPEQDGGGGGQDDGRRGAAYPSLWPQVPQNLEPGATAALHWGQEAAAREAPQLPQNLAPAGTAARHCGHAEAVMTVPQLPQNFAPSGTRVWHFGHATDVPAGAFARPCAPMPPAVMPGIIIPMPAPSPRPAALPASPGFLAASSIPRAALKAM